MKRLDWTLLGIVTLLSLMAAIVTFAVLHFTGVTR